MCIFCYRTSPVSASKCLCHLSLKLTRLHACHQNSHHRDLHRLGHLEYSWVVLDTYPWTTRTWYSSGIWIIPGVSLVVFVYHQYNLDILWQSWTSEYQSQKSASFTAGKQQGSVKKSSSQW